MGGSLLKYFTYFLIVNSQCIKKTWLWDGDEDCSNGEDELIRSNHDGWIGFENQCQTNCDGGPDCFISEKDSNIVMRGALNTNEKFKLVAYYRGKMNLSKMATQCSSIMKMINGLVVNVEATVQSKDAQVNLNVQSCESIEIKFQ